MLSRHQPPTPPSTRGQGCLKTSTFIIVGTASMVLSAPQKSRDRVAGVGLGTRLLRAWTPFWRSATFTTPTHVRQRISDSPHEASSAGGLYCDGPVIGVQQRSRARPCRGL